MRRSTVALAAAVAAAVVFAADTVGGIPATMPPVEEVRRVVTPTDVEAAYARATVMNAPPVAALEAGTFAEWSEALALLRDASRPPQAARDLR